MIALTIYNINVVFQIWQVVAEKFLEDAEVKNFWQLKPSLGQD
ncbi:MAG: hypothetical protein ACRAVC_21620 [Trichormus sp.]